MLNGFLRIQSGAAGKGEGREGGILRRLQNKNVNKNKFFRISYAQCTYRSDDKYICT